MRMWLRCREIPLVVVKNMEELLYPTPDTVFNETDDTKESTFTIGKIFNPQDDYSISFYIYAQNFRRAAEEVSEYMLKDPDIGKLDSLFFCISFLYRHSLELILKAIVFQYESDKAKRIEVIKESFHNCKKLLDCVEPYLNSNVHDFDRGAYEWIHDYLSDFSIIDKESDSFRYPFHILCGRNAFGDREYSIKHVFEEQTHIDLKKFILKLDLACIILDAYYNRANPFDGVRDSGFFTNNDTQTYRDYRPQFIEEGGSYFMQSFVGFKYQHMEHFPYVLAYLDAGNVLKAKIDESIKNNDFKTRNVLFMPMCYCYRNGLELSLKKIWYEDIDNDMQLVLKQMQKKKHKLIGLWNLLLPTIDAFDGERNKRYNAVEGTYIASINTFDSDASHFRYPCDKLMNAYYYGNEKIDYRSMGDYMEAAINYLEGVDSSLEAIYWNN